MTDLRKINVAISLLLSEKPGISIWSNGAVQHSVFLFNTLKNLPFVDNVWLGTYGSEKLHSKWLMDDIQQSIAPMSDVIEETDLLIELSAMVPEHHIRVVRDRGGKYVTYKIGNDLILAMESMIFNAHSDWIPNPKRLHADAVWTNAQFVNSCATFFEHIYKARPVCLPHLWSPFFLEKAIRSNLKSQLGWPYKAQFKKSGKKISVFEPNISVVKTSTIPFLISASFYEKNKAAVENIYIYNGMKIKQNRAFKRLVMSTDAGSQRVASAEGRFNFADAMGQNSGVVVTNQWENALNYLYYEALYGGFGLVHNSPFLKDVGYYYEGFDVEDGVRALERAVFEHDENLEAYRENANAFLATVDPASEQVIAEYDREVRRLIS